MKNSNNTIGNRTRDLPACSSVPQPMRHRVPPFTAWYVKSCLAVACIVQTQDGPNTMHRSVQHNVLLDTEELKIRGTELQLGKHSGWFYGQSNLLYNGYQTDTLPQGKVAVHKRQSSHHLENCM